MIKSKIAAKFMTGITFMVILILLCVIAIPVCAQEYKGNIKLNCHIQSSQGIVSLINDSYSIAKIANVSINENQVLYQTLPVFSAFSCDWTNLTDKERQLKAEQIESYVLTNHLFQDSVAADENGIVDFGSLDTGLCLISRTRIDNNNQKYLLKPFLLDVPTAVNGVLYYDIIATPKFEYPNTNSVSAQDTSTPVPSASQTLTNIIEKKDISAKIDSPPTGDITNIQLLRLCFILSGIFTIVLGGATVWRRQKTFIKGRNMPHGTR